MILVTGANGYVGTHLALALRNRGHEVRALIRAGKNDPHCDLLVKAGIEVVGYDLRRDSGWHNAVRGCDRIAHLIGSIQPARGDGFYDMHVKRSLQMIAAAREHKVKKIVFLSVIGANPNARSQYLRTKGMAEDAIRASSIPHAIIRASLIYGRTAGEKDSKTMVKFLNMIKKNGVVKIAGTGSNRIQPVFIDDLVECIVRALTNEDINNVTIDVAGPEALTMHELIGRLLAAAGRPDVPIKKIPAGIAKCAAFLMQTFSSKPLLTTDQLKTMKTDLVGNIEVMRNALGVEPLALDDGLARYFR